MDEEANAVAQAVALAPSSLESLALSLAERAVADAAALLEDLEEAHSAAHLGICTWTVGTQELDWSPEMYRIAGADRAGFTPTLDALLALIHANDRDRLKAMLDGAIASGMAREEQFRIVRPDGSRRHCWARLRPLRGGQALRAIVLDTTERVETEQALRASEEHYHWALQLNPQIPWSADPDGKILDVGARWSELIDGPSDRWSHVIHAEDLEPARQSWAQSLANGEPLDTSYRMRLRNGQYHWFRVRARTRRDEDGNVVRWYGLLEDIHDRVSAQRALDESEEWLNTAHEAAGIGLFEVDLKSAVARMSRQGRVLYGMPADSDGVLHDKGDWVGLIHPDDAEPAWEALGKAIETGNQYDFVFRVPLHDGRVRWLHGLGRVQYDALGRPSRLLGINIDVTARMETEARLEQSEALNRSIVEATPDSIKLIDLDGIVLFVNDGGLAALELEDGAALIGRSWLSLWPAGAQPRAREAIASALAGGVGRFSAARATAKGKPRWWDVLISPVLGEDGSPQRLVSIARDITQQKTAEERIHWSATHDPLTQLPNRRLFEQRLAEAIDEAEVSGRSVGLLALDLDRFKQINDTLGHDAGNSILVTVADRLRAAIRPADLAARLGGDEFAVIVPDIDGQDGLALVAARILNALRQPVVYGGHTLDCRASVGASIYPNDGAAPADVLKHADLALYSSKAAHHEGLLMFEPQMGAELQQRVSMIRIAREALGEDRLRPYYQPKVNLVSGAVIGFEALARLEDLAGKIHPPAIISAAFDDFHVSTAITDRMLASVIRDMRGWIDHGSDFSHIAINASASDFRRGGFAERVLEALARAEVTPNLLQIEVTETVFLGRGADYVEQALKLLSREGIKIALDDFGTGYASLSHLKQFPVDLIKIDRGFVADLGDECADAAIVEAVVNLGRSLKIEVVAEGVESSAQAMRLRRLGCKYGQGFLYSEAVPASQVPELATRKFLPLRARRGAASAVTEH